MIVMGKQKKSKPEIAQVAEWLRRFLETAEIRHVDEGVSKQLEHAKDLGEKNPQTYQQSYLQLEVEMRAYVRFKVFQEGWHEIALSGITPDISDVLVTEEKKKKK